MADMVEPVIVSNLFAGMRIKRPNMIGNGDVKYTANQKRCAFNDRLCCTALRADGRDLVNPLLRDLIYVGGCNLVQSAVTLAGVVSVEGGPTRNWWLPERIWIERDRRLSA